MTLCPRWWLALCLAVETAVLALSLWLGPRVPHLYELLVLGPLLGCARLGARGTAVAALGALLLAVALAAGVHARDTRDVDFVLPLTVAAGGALCVRMAHARSVRADELRRLTEVAQVAQRAVVRPIDTEIGGMAVVARCHSAARHALVGGDLYDLAHTPFGLRLLLGDVRGQGLEAVRLAAATLATFRDLAYTTPGLPALVSELDARIGPQLGAEDFITVVLAEFAPGEVRLVNCGHHPPIRIGLRMEPLAPAHPSPPLGLRPQPVQQRASLSPDQRLLLYTDGLVEARNRDGTMFALDEQARRALTGSPLPDALGALYDNLLAHAGSPLRDDLALVLCEPTVPVSPSAPTAEGAAAALGPTDAHRLPGRTPYSS